jgi:VanZ family protein
LINNIKQLIKWLPAVLMMCVIFAFSVQNGNASNNTSGKVCYAVAKVTVDDFAEMPKTQQQIIIEALQHMVRKTAHFTEYALLGMAFLIPLWGKFKRPIFAPALAVLLSALYACTDEAHQLIVSERSGQLTDVAIDTAGTLAGVALVCGIVWLIKKLKRKSEK